MKIISYNVNGIRAALRKGLVEWLTHANPDILCLQETKAHPEQVDIAELEALGYRGYWNSADKKGYSGVAIFSKEEPLQITTETGIPLLEGEGRLIRADFPTFSVLSLYVPSGTRAERLAFKLDFCYQLTEYLQSLPDNIKEQLIVCGDYNVCHHPIDIHDPVRNKKVSGFLPEEREWLTDYIEKCRFVDSFRHFNAEPDQYTWWSYRAASRKRNKGWRIDYHMVSEAMKGRLKRSLHLPEAKHSDHCPILLEFD